MYATSVCFSSNFMSNSFYLLEFFFLLIVLEIFFRYPGQNIVKNLFIYPLGNMLRSPFRNIFVNLLGNPFRNPSKKSVEKSVGKFVGKFVGKSIAKSIRKSVRKFFWIFVRKLDQKPIKTSLCKSIWNLYLKKNKFKQIDKTCLWHPLEFFDDLILWIIGFIQIKKLYSKNF